MGTSIKDDVWLKVIWQNVYNAQENKHMVPE